MAALVVADDIPEENLNEDVQHLQSAWMNELVHIS